MRRRDRCGQRARRTASLCSGAFACINAYGIITGYTFTGHIITGYIFTGFIYNFTGFIYNFTGIISITTITTSSATLYCFERPSSLAFYFFSGNHFTGCILTGIIYITGNSFTGFSIASSTSIMSIKTFDVTISAVPHALWCSSSSFHDESGRRLHQYIPKTLAACDATSFTSTSVQRVGRDNHQFCHFCATSLEASLTRKLRSSTLNSRRRMP